MKIQTKNVRVEIGPIPKKKRGGIIYFSDFEEMNKVLNSRRIELLNVIKEKQPESIYELAQILKMDQGNVTKDINLLEEYGFINIQRTKHGERSKSQPIFDNNNIEMVIKIGAGMFGVAKEVLEDISKEFKDDNLTKNKEYVKKTFQKVLSPVTKTAKKIVDKLDG